EIVQRSGVAVEVYTFVGASAHRRAAEGWELGALGRRVEQAGDRCRREGLRWTLVTEDTSRTKARDLEFLFDTAWEAGASRLCLCDTAGYANPSGTRALIEWTQRWRSDRAAKLELDWHPAALHNLADDCDVIFEGSRRGERDDAKRLLVVMLQKSQRVLLCARARSGKPDRRRFDSDRVQAA
ncbi:MAG: hypothetical protein AAFZ38_12760, partial [Myxococcota bacterium]